MTPAIASFVAGTLSPAMIEALRRCQRDLFDERPLVDGGGMTLKALRRRGLVEGKRPAARLTTLGELVVGAAGLDRPEAADV